MHDQDDAEARLQALHELKGADLIGALIKELGELYREISQLKKEMSAYRDYQAARDRWLVIDTVQKTRAQLPKSVTIDASQSLAPRQGFYGLEYGGRGTPFSWTGPGNNFSFDIYIDRTLGAELELRALSVMNFDKQKNIKVLVNGETVPATVSRNGTGLIVNANLPPRDDDRVCNIVFCVPENLRPADSNDKRLLGIAFHSLALRSRTELDMLQPKSSDDTVVTLSRAAKKTEEKPAGDAKSAPDAAAL